MFRSVTASGEKVWKVIPARLILLPFFIGHNLVLASPAKPIRDLSGLSFSFQ